MVTALPAARVDLALELSGSPAGLDYDWVGLGSLGSREPKRPLDGALFAPNEPGFYRLRVIGPHATQLVDSLVLGVLKPLAAKRGGAINGYRIGYYKGELRGDYERTPAGFLEVNANSADLPVSRHLVLKDFLTHDGQAGWPRYVAVEPKLLDKLELVFDEVLKWRGSRADGSVDVDVHSGFRTPLHNRSVRRAASDSRHQYGDAADVAIDANGDGRITSVDVSLVARAVERVELKHPQLSGGLGTYFRGSPYAHIDVRGARARWRG